MPPNGDSRVLFSRPNTILDECREATPGRPPSSLVLTDTGKHLKDVTRVPGVAKTAKVGNRNLGVPDLENCEFLQNWAIIALKFSGFPTADGIHNTLPYKTECYVTLTIFRLHKIAQD